jgi:hypothetical protein
LLPLRVAGVPSLLLAPLVALAFFGATLAACGVGAGVRTWIAFQIRATAVLRSVNFLTGFRKKREVLPGRHPRSQRPGQNKPRSGSA